MQVGAKVVCPNALLKVKDSELHEYAVAEKDTIGQSSIRRPISMSHEPLQGRKELVVEYERHRDQTYSNREKRSR